MHVYDLYILIYNGFQDHHYMHLYVCFYLHIYAY